MVPVILEINSNCQHLISILTNQHQRFLFQFDATFTSFFFKRFQISVGMKKNCAKVKTTFLLSFYFSTVQFTVSIQEFKLILYFGGIFCIVVAFESIIKCHFLTSFITKNLPGSYFCVSYNLNRPCTSSTNGF